MRYRRLASAVAAAVAAAAIGVSITPASQAAAPASQAAAPAPKKVVVDCLGHKQVEPRQFVFTCADGNDYLDKLTWTSWTPTMATAFGVQTMNDCTPYCAAGHFHSYPVLVVFFGSAPYRGSQRYREVTLIYTGTRPPHAAQTSTGQLMPPYGH